MPTPSKKATKMPNYDVHAKHHFFMPKTSKRPNFWNLVLKMPTCQPGPILPQQEQIHADKLGVPN